MQGSARVSKPISCHPDIFMCKLRGGIYFGDENRLKMEYPGDCIYNAASLGKYLICSKYTDSGLITKANCNIILVNQGYTKCNLVILDEKHVITEDEGIAKVLNGYSDIECLLISGHEVSLPGHKYGFIGGASGKVGEEIIFNGNLAAHSDFERIKDFIEKTGLKLRYFESYPLTDIGSIIEENVEI